MSITSKIKNTIVEGALGKTEKDMNAPNKKEEWIWVEGYKGTDADMRCRGYQYEFDKQFDIPENEEVEMCKKGFHLCLG